VALGPLVDARFMPDWGSGSATVQDAFIDVKFSPWTVLRVGKFKAPVGLERLRSATDLAFVERALPTNLVPNRDLGVQLGGELGGGVVAYQLALLDGANDGGSLDQDLNDSKELALRVWASPLKQRAASRLRGLGFGLVVTEGSSRGSVSAPGLSAYRTAGQLAFFSYRTGRTLDDTVVLDNQRRRAGLQAEYELGRMALQAEWIRSRVDVSLGTQRARLTHSAAQLTAQIALTRDRAVAKGFDPRKPWNPAARQFGGLELVLRAGRLRLDDETFPIYADPTRSASSARELGVGINWYPIRQLKLSLDGVETRFGRADGGPEREQERVLLSRIQVAF
jgi:phosphate-selective porin OprO/OprP